MSPAPLAFAAEIEIPGREESRIGKVRTLPPPFMKSGRSFMGDERVAQVRQPLGFLERQRAQQQRIHDAENAAAGSDPDCQGKNREGDLPGMAPPKSDRVPGILPNFTDKLTGNGSRQIRHQTYPEHA